MTQAFHPHSLTSYPGMLGRSPSAGGHRRRLADALRLWVGHHVVAMDPRPEVGALDRLDRLRRLELVDHLDHLDGPRHTGA